MSILVWIAFTLCMIVWTIINWKHEFKYITESFQCGEYGHTARGVWNFVLDLVITTSATGILGLNGFYAAGLAIFFSNMISVIFFAPPRSWHERSHQNA